MQHWIIIPRNPATRRDAIYRVYCNRVCIISIFGIISAI